MIKFIFIAILNLFYFQSISQHKETEIIATHNSDTLWGTLCSPQQSIDTSQPLVLIIAGSGPTDRNGNNSVMTNNSLQMLAHDLAKLGIASIRYDKRGVGASFKAYIPEIDLTFEDNVNIAEEFYDYGKKQGYQKIIIAGHSEGSLIGILLSQRKKPAGFISLAGAGRPIQDVLKEQYNVTAPIVRDSAHVIIDLLASGVKVDTLSPWLYSVFRPAIQPYLISWMKYIPNEEINKLSCPSLIIQGERDLQVTKEDATELGKDLPENSVVLIETMNHVLKKVDDDKADNKASYNDPVRPLHPDLIFTMVSFIKQLP
ncbi:MAG: alpha/beta hydrolase [Flavobacteriales bacterium]|nr:alpha/beta hydrolase [Flavobacteriales bacterium]